MYEICYGKDKNILKLIVGWLHDSECTRNHPIVFFKRVKL